MNTQSKVHKVLLLLAGIALYSPALVFSAEGGAQKELVTAEEHAGFASKVENVDDTHLHLHHVINCLVGPKGKDFDAKAGNPCKGQGNGALNDKSIAKAQRETLKQVLTLAKVGVQIKSYEPAHDTALAVKALLAEVNQGM